MSRVSRRQFIITAGAATAGSLLAHGCSSGPTDSAKSASKSSPVATSTAANAPKVETTTAKLGFIALTDSAPLVVAQEKGLFAKYGMTEVEVVKQASWPVTRDNLELGTAGNAGGIDGAHILSPMPYFMSLGQTKNKQPVPMYILARLNTNGQAISVANTYKESKVGLDSKGLKEAFTKAGGKNDFKAAITYPGGTHDLWMRYWLAAGGIDPNKDISTVPVPPPQMVANMKTGNMEAFCVGEPWNAQLVNQGQGYTALVTGELWKDHPEKAFAMRADWVDKNPNSAKALLMAIQEAQQWCDKAENKEEMCQIVSQAKWFKVPAKDIIERSKGNIDYGDGRPVVQNSPLLMKFWSDNASYPYKSHDTWFLTENIRWGNIPADTNIKELVDKVNREDLWKEAAKALGVPASEIPTSSSRGVETFFDGVKFDPEKPEEYLKSLKIKKA
ncbi:ABC transporter substrate-binding protein [Coleofasciculus sp. FACHB-64]|uniref:CmpA/NrtA family ABC transporter substrate-binding protein n=1 Tax=Cyanophyceae TaxID=3028117 RepID=UPI001683A99D|nr:MULTISPECIES: CmpA/NrtA family ABC transporter substrate-binding protein [unclassified Coleofasciculus]MBD1837057.1 ABC transporter substrate-binding protein [Coleofasciculus sp. FACHB-501]MBD1891719.1 ABC transporter substrate-binding protein [Coleofasciculus sp. FACHB-SPT9]MBD2048624.1 ABC transporter substrate-binding protein [Coleofasciculus sp. FACHB-64]MBD2539776.1 ABC transporter substrate-binding protein [Coleofasciculus sp. FACHB-SPT36]